MAKCEFHSGFETEFTNIHRWQDVHLSREHQQIDEKLVALRDRLPLWAVTLISVLMALIGYLVGFLKLIH